MSAPTLPDCLPAPLTEKIAGKFSFSYRNRDGWVDNVVLDKKQKDDDVQAYRGQLLYTSEDTEIMFSADYNRLDVEDMARIPQTQISRRPRADRRPIPRAVRQQRAALFDESQ